MSLRYETAPNSFSTLPTDIGGFMAKFGLHYGSAHLLRNDAGKPVMFRGQSSTQETLSVGESEGSSVYGRGAYLGNCPSAVAIYSQGGEDYGIAAYEIVVSPADIALTSLNRMDKKGENHKVAVAPMPRLTNLAGRILYSSHNAGLKPMWVLIRESTAPEVIRGATRIAWLGHHYTEPRRVLS